MIIRQVDTANDWTFGKGVASYATLDGAIGQNIRGRLLSFKADCFFDLEAGVDWRSRFDIGEQANLLDELQTLILQSEGVVALNSINVVFDPHTRAATISYSIKTIYSPAFVGEVTMSAGA